MESEKHFEILAAYSISAQLKRRFPTAGVGSMKNALANKSDVLRTRCPG
jgi:hypothetical protein